MTKTDLEKRAEKYAHSQKNRLAKELTDMSKYAPDEYPISAFMAGSPGAGKTEYSKNIINILEDEQKHKVIRIDADELRKLIPEYNGSNSYLFQGAVSVFVEKIHDEALANRQSFLLDGTFSNYDKAVLNIRRSLKRGRSIFIFYVYQNPEIAWRFTMAREKLEGRNIPKHAFIRQFLESRQTVIKIREEFDDEVVIFLVKKNYATHSVEDVVQIKQRGPAIDSYLGIMYSRDDLEKLL